MFWKKSYEKGYQDGLKSRERVITFMDLYEFHIREHEGLTTEEKEQLKILIRQPQYEMLRKWLILEALSHYEIGRGQPPERRAVLDEVGKFAESIVTNLDMLRDEKKPEQQESSIFDL